MVRSEITQRVWRLRSKRISLRLVLLCLLSLLLFTGWRVLVWEVMPLHAIAFSADGRRLAALGGLPDTSSGPAMRFELAVWDLPSGEKRLAIPLPPRTY